MSRSAFAARFTELVGEPVMHYVARWRRYPSVKLQDEGATVGQSHIGSATTGGCLARA